MQYVTECSSIVLYSIWIYIWLILYLYGLYPILIYIPITSLRTDPMPPGEMQARHIAQAKQLAANKCLGGRWQAGELALNQATFMCNQLVSDWQ